MLKLTNEEKKALQAKFDAFTNFNNTFTYSYSLQDTFFTKFTCKEVLSEDFYPKMYNEIHKWHQYGTNYIENILLNRSRRSLLTADFFSSLNLSEEESLKLADEIINITRQHYITGSFLQPYVTLIENIILKYKGSKESVLMYLFEHNGFEKVGIEYLRSFIDNFVSTGNITDPLVLVKLIQEKVPYYNNLPLIILNNNISKENKIKAIKASYRQKDLPQYKVYLRRNVNDFDCIDTFLQATIFQNNRVKEKEVGFIDFLKKIFINGEETTLGSRGRTFDNVKSFTLKYIDYFKDENFMKKLWVTTVNSMSTNKYSRERQYDEFCKTLFADFSFDEKIELATNNMYLKFFTRLPDLLTGACNAGDTDKIRKLANMFITWYNKNHDLEEFYSYIESSYEINSMVKYCPDLLTNFFKEYVVYNTRKGNLYNSRDLMLNFIESCETSDLLYHPEIFMETKFFNPEDLKYFGYDFKNLKARKSNRSYYYSGGYDIQTIARGNNAVFKLCKTLLASEKIEPEMKVQLARKFKETFNLEYFNAEENVAIITDNIMQINQDADLKHDGSGWRTGTPTAQRYTENVEAFIEVINKISELLNDESILKAATNLQDSVETIKLICAIQ